MLKSKGKPDSIASRSPVEPLRIFVNQTVDSIEPHPINAPRYSLFFDRQNDFFRRSCNPPIFCSNKMQMLLLDIRFHLQSIVDYLALFEWPTQTLPELCAYIHIRWGSNYHAGCAKIRHYQTATSTPWPSRHPKHAPNLRSLRCVLCVMPYY